jgi:hypothetical protein
MGTTRMQTKTEAPVHFAYCACCGQAINDRHQGCACSGCNVAPNHCSDCGFPISSRELQDWHTELTCEGVLNARYT